MKTQIFVLILILGLGYNLASCTKNQQSTDDQTEELPASREPHQRDYEKHEGEEDGSMFASNYQYDKISSGVRLKLSFDQEQSRFVGSIQNTTEQSLDRVRVEIHLSNGKELGPTVATSLKPGEEKTISLSAKGEVFERWSTHPEVGSNEHEHGAIEHQKGSEHGKNGHDREHEEHGEHDTKRKNEHN